MASSAYPSSSYPSSSLWTRPESPMGWTSKEKGVSPPSAGIHWNTTLDSAKADFTAPPRSYLGTTGTSGPGITPHVPQAALSPRVPPALSATVTSPTRPALDVTHDRSLIPAIPPPSRDVSGVVQALERELSQERFERREQVAFLTKMHEREAALLKSRADMAEQKLEEERRLFEKEKTVLSTRARFGDDEEQAASSKFRNLEQEMSRKSEALMELRMQLTQTEERLFSSNAQIDDLHRQVSHVRTEEQAEKDTLIRQDVQLRSARDEHFRLENEIETQKRSRDALEEHLRRTERDTEASWNQTQQLHEQEQQRLLQEGTRWRDISQDVSKKAVDLEGRFEVMRRDCLSVREELKASESRCQDVSSMLQTVERERDEWIRKHRSCHEVLERVQLEVHQEKVARTQLEHSSDEKLQSASRQLQDFDSSLKDTRWKYDKLEQSTTLEAIKFRTEIDEFQRALGKADAAKAEQDQVIAELKSVQTTADQERHSLASKVRTLDDKIQQEALSKVQIQGSLDTVKRERDQIQAMVESFKTQVQTLEHKSSQYERERDSAFHMEAEEKKKYEDYRSRMQQWQREEERRLQTERQRAESMYQQAQGDVARSEATKAELERTLQALQDETRQLAMALQVQHEKAVSLDGSMRKHLHVLDHRIQDLQEETRSGIASTAMLSTGFPGIRPRTPSPIKTGVPSLENLSPSRLALKSPTTNDPLYRSLAVPSLPTHLGVSSLSNPIPATPMPGLQGSSLSPRLTVLSPRDSSRRIGAGPSIPEGPLSPKSAHLRPSPSAGRTP
eukprot:gnl/MRDRNA2_/MRDRNA2_92775_c0_seq1.p1 gnl/MRDRNA2_/MRDRNA2_92775_c0~~gnl/MRDRNA2_/MRDRNA2_92775_c0_seq1.p1  ORF type:complete len:791 (+),score=183.34 gnl/MRDRNA2_/MRDRNA2_92775_c0_seq1:84-2456(+)